jgi:hypothetical protein
VDIITAATMKSLVDHTADRSVSIYLPTHRSGRETQQDPIRLRNLLDHARDELCETGMRRPAADSVLQPARDLAEMHSFWQYQEDGLAVFLTDGNMETFRLPEPFDPFVTVADSFHVKPLWPVVGDGIFYILALSRNEIRLWWSDRFQIGDVDLPADTPKSLAEALWFYDPEKQLQYHMGNRDGRGRMVAQFHGHGASAETDTAKIEAYLRSVDAGVRSLIDAGSPLVLVGVTEITSRYRHVSQHPRIVDDTIRGNPDERSAEELHRSALPIVEPMMATRAKIDAEAFLAAKQRAVSSVPEAVTAAVTGRVKHLFLPLEVHVWGHCDATGAEVTTHDDWQPGDRDLLDLAGAATWSSGGTVYARPADQIPGNGPVAATLRF